MTKLAVVTLDDQRYGAGPGTVIEVTCDGVLDVIRRYQDRDGARHSGLRFWNANETTKVGDRVMLAKGTKT